MTDSSSVEEKQDQRDRPRLEFPILQAFPRAVAECRTYPVTTTVIAVCVVNFLLVNLVTNYAGSVVQDILVPSSRGDLGRRRLGVGDPRVRPLRVVAHPLQHVVGSRLRTLAGARPRQASLHRIHSHRRHRKFGMATPHHGRNGNRLLRSCLRAVRLHPRPTTLASGVPGLSSLEHDLLAARMARVLCRADDRQGVERRQRGPHRWPGIRLPARPGPRTPEAPRGCGGGLEHPVHRRRRLLQLHAVVGRVAGPTLHTPGRHVATSSGGG